MQKIQKVAAIVWVYPIKITSSKKRLLFSYDFTLILLLSLLIFSFKIVVDELERYMDPAYGDSDVSDSVKLELILTEEDSIQEQYALLTQLATLKKNLESQPFAGKILRKL